MWWNITNLHIDTHRRWCQISRRNHFIIFLECLLCYTLSILVQYKIFFHDEGEWNRDVRKYWGVMKFWFWSRFYHEHLSLSSTFYYLLYLHIIICCKSWLSCLFYTFLHVSLRQHIEAPFHSYGKIIDLEIFLYTLSVKKFRQVK